MKKIGCILGLHKGEARLHFFSPSSSATTYRTCEYCGKIFDIHFAVVENKELAHFKKILLENCSLVVSDNLQIRCGKFELFSESGFPENTQIKIDGQRFDCATSVNFYMDCEKVELKIGVEPYIPQKHEGD